MAGRPPHGKGDWSVPAGVGLVRCRQGWEELWRRGCWGPSLQAAQEPEGWQEGEHLEGWQSPTLRTWGLRVEGRVTPTPEACLTSSTCFSQPAHPILFPHRQPLPGPGFLPDDKRGESPPSHSTPGHRRHRRHTQSRSSCTYTQAATCIAVMGSHMRPQSSRIKTTPNMGSNTLVYSWDKF